MYDELQLDTLGDKKTALFLIMSDTDSTFNFLISMVYTQLFNLLCDKADDVYGGKLPIDERGFVFVIFTICSLAEQLGRSTVSVSSALKELDAAGLIERRRTRFSSPNHIFVKIPNVE